MVRKRGFMREILFKAKRVDNGEWVEGFLMYSDEDYRIITSYLTDSNPCCATMVCAYAIDPDTLCQYTGLTDKNGKRIWENDIIKTCKFGRDDGKGYNYAGFDVFSVKWDNGGFALFNRWRRYNLREDNKEYETVGNIFDNLELLEHKPCEDEIEI